MLILVIFRAQVYLTCTYRTVWMLGWFHVTHNDALRVLSFQNFILSTGSSVATSLCEGEAVKKHVALLEINDERSIKPTALPLKTVRPFVMKVSLNPLQSIIFYSLALFFQVYFANKMSKEVKE